MDSSDAKSLVARRALDFVEDGMAIGLGSGTTATLFIRELGQRVQQGFNVRCIATSELSETLAKSLGIKIVTFEDCPTLDLAIDGADEIAPGLNLIKGGGGNLLREKIVASAAKRMIVIVDASKEVETLGRFPLPVEVIRMAMPLVSRKLSDLGIAPALRKKEGKPYVTDEGNYLLDCACHSIPDPARLAASIRSIVGVVEHGLFLNMASLALIARAEGVVERHE